MLAGKKKKATCVILRVFCCAVATRAYFNKNVSTVLKSCLASCSTLASYQNCCKHNERWLLITCSDGRTRLITLDNDNTWRQVEQEVVLILEHILYLKPEYVPRGHLGRILIRQQNQLYQLLYGSVLLSFRDMTTRRRSDGRRADVDKHCISGR